MSTLPALNLSKILEGVPRGAWVAISEENQTVVAYGSDMRAVLKEAKDKGEPDPLITRVPEQNTLLAL